MVHFLTVDEQKEWVKKATYVEREKASDQENKRKKKTEDKVKESEKEDTETKEVGVPTYLNGFVCPFHPTAPGSSPKHTIYAFIYLLYCVTWKRQK